MQSRLAEASVLCKRQFIANCQLPIADLIKQRSHQEMGNRQFASAMPYLFPCAIFTASGNPRRRSIEIIPNSGPGARIMKA